MKITNGLALACVLFSSLSVSAQDATNEHFNQYKQKHSELVPVVAVADMYYGCSVMRLNKTPDYSVNHMVTMLDRDLLADNLSRCLNEDSLKSEVAINFGLYGCFFNQMSHLSDKERESYMDKVNGLLGTLSKEQKQKSFTQCVSDQTVNYIDIK